MPRVKVIYNRKGCIGASACVLVAPKFWKMVEDGKAELLGSKLNPETGKHELEIEISEADLKSLRDSAESCPVQVIQLQIIEEE